MKNGTPIPANLEKGRRPGFLKTKPCTKTGNKITSTPVATDLNPVDESSAKTAIPGTTSNVIWIVSLYVVMSALWILFSDKLLALLVTDPSARIQWSIFKGWGFVAVTGLLLYLLISRLVSIIEDGAANRKLSEEKSKASESLFKEILINMPIEFWARDMDERCNMENPALIRHWGSLLGKRPEDSSVSPEELAVWKSNNRRAYAGELIEEEVSYNIDGGTRFFKNIISPFRIGGKICGILGFNVDITEQKKALESVRENESKYRNYIDGCPAGILVFDSMGRCLEANPAACEMAGCTEAELMSLNATNLIRTESVANAQYHLDQFKKTGQATLDLEFRRKDNSKVFLTLNVFTLSPDRFIAFSQDITSRKLAHYAMRASEKQYRTTIDALNDAIFVVNQNLKLILLNKTINLWCENFGLKKARQGQSLPEAFPFLPDHVYGEYREVFETGTPKSGSETFRFNDREMIVETLKIPIIEDGRTIRVVAVKRDVTEQRKIESQSLRAQRMECIGTLASGVAHDLNNVLSPIMMGAAMLHDDLPAELHEQLVSTIESAAQRGADIVKQVLFFARGVEGERMMIQPVHLVRDIEKIAHETFPKSITILSKCAEEIWSIQGDTTQLQQVFLNLCVNARDAMPEGGTLTLAVENQELDAAYASMVPGAEAGRYVMFSVRDTGVGMSKEIVEKIFDPFFTTKKVGQGTGLGLSMVIGIVKSHGGFLTVDSHPGSGSEFKVFIPAVFSEKSLTDTASPEEPADCLIGKGELVLLVDDEDGILIMGEQILKKFGYQVITARDGVEAISIYAAQQNEIKLVITDVMMPFVDGVTLSRALKKMNPSVPIIASTGQADKTRQDELREQGITLFLLKPYNSRQLLNAISMALPQ